MSFYKLKLHYNTVLQVKNELTTLFYMLKVNIRRHFKEKHNLLILHSLSLYIKSLTTNIKLQPWTQINPNLIGTTKTHASSQHFTQKSSKQQYKFPQTRNKQKLVNHCQFFVPFFPKQALDLATRLFFCANENKFGISSSFHYFRFKNGETNRRGLYVSNDRGVWAGAYRLQRAGKLELRWNFIISCHFSRKSSEIPKVLSCIRISASKSEFLGYFYDE